MRKTVGITAGVVAAIAIVLVAASCSDSTSSKNATYVANLVAANEVPPKTSAGSGTVTLVDFGSEIDWTLELTNMTNVTQSHIHVGAAGTAPAGNIIFNLFIPQTTVAGPLNGFVAQGTITSANNANVSLDSLRVLLNNGNAYANVHTTANPAGEIRDQLHRVN